MPRPAAATKHAAVLIETSRSYGRDILRGIRRWMHEHEAWSLFLELRALDSTDLSLAAIAARCGFEHPQHMAEAFKKNFGMTPGRYRQSRRGA